MRAVCEFGYSQVVVDVLNQYEVNANVFHVLLVGDCFKLLTHEMSVAKFQDLPKTEVAQAKSAKNLTRVGCVGKSFGT